MNAALANAVSIFAIAWLVISTDSPKLQVLNLFHFFVPATLAMGFGGLWLAMRAARRDGWSDTVEGLATLSALALAWGHYGAWTAIRRAADAAGYEEAMRFDTSPYRLASGLFLATAVSLVIRWGTRPSFGEWASPAIALGWAAVVVLAGKHLQAVLVWIYLLRS